MITTTQPPILAPSPTERLTVLHQPDTITLHAGNASLPIPRRLVKDVAWGLGILNTMPSTLDFPEDYELSLPCGDEVTVFLHGDASVVIVIGPDDEPARAIEVPGVEVERLVGILMGQVA